MSGVDEDNASYEVRGVHCPLHLQDSFFVNVSLGLITSHSLLIHPVDHRLDYAVKSVRDEEEHA